MCRGGEGLRWLRCLIYLAYRTEYTETEVLLLRRCAAICGNVRCNTENGEVCNALTGTCDIKCDGKDNGAPCKLRGFESTCAAGVCKGEAADFLCIAMYSLRFARCPCSVVLLSVQSYCLANQRVSCTCMRYGMCTGNAAAGCAVSHTCKMLQQLWSANRSLVAAIPHCAVYPVPQTSATMHCAVQQLGMSCWFQRV